MKRGFEASDLLENRIEARPGELLCACCMCGGAVCTQEDPERVRCLQERIRQDVNVHITLKTAFDEAGARTELYHATTPAQRKRDLDILQKMGATPETVRTAQVWGELLQEYLPDPAAICAPYAQETALWKNCPNARADYYKNGLAVLCPPRDPAEKACAKACSCQSLAEAETFCVRAHHFLCMMCFLGGENADQPLAEDNLYELWQKIKENPNIPITLIEGPGDCVVCPPCYAFNPKSRLCFVSCSLKDRKKDLDVFAKLGIQPGDTLPARQILEGLYRTINGVEEICAYDVRRGFEWRNCISIGDGSFEKGVRIVADTLGLRK